MGYQKYFPVRLISLLCIVILTIYPQFSPAADKKLKVHILGDSITQSIKQNYCWRYWIWLKLKENGLHDLVDFVGSSSGPGKEWDSQHDGHWGYSSKQILKGLKEWAPRFKGDIALIHLGTNDMKEPDITQIVDGFEEIISLLRTHNASVRIVVGQISSWSEGRDKKVSDFNKELLTLKILGTHTSPVQIIDLSKHYDRKADNYDGIHPNESGAKKYSEAFYPALVNMIHYQQTSLTGSKIARVKNCPAPVTGKQWYQLHGQLFLIIPASSEKQRVFLSIQGKRIPVDERFPR